MRQGSSGPYDGVFPVNYFFIIKRFPLLGPISVFLSTFSLVCSSMTCLLNLAVKKSKSETFLCVVPPLSMLLQRRIFSCSPRRNQLRYHHTAITKPLCSQRRFFWGDYENTSNLSFLSESSNPNVETFLNLFKLPQSISFFVPLLAYLLLQFQGDK